jgi:hypothetical protein
VRSLNQVRLIHRMLHSSPQAHTHFLSTPYARTHRSSYLKTADWKAK